MMLKVHKMLPVAAMLSLAAVLSACKDEKAATPPPAAAAPAPEVAVLTLQPERVAISTELPGRTAAYRVAEVRPQVSGIILKRLFVEGSDVKAGQQLYQIDPATYQAALDVARADLAKAQASLKSVQTKAARYADLVSINAVSRQDYDDIVASLDQNRAQVAAAKAAVETARINLDYTKVFAPIAGRIGKSSVTEGALVTANQDAPLATVQQLDPIYVDITQSSSELMQLRRDIAVGKLQGADMTQAPVTLLLEGGQVYDLPGQLQFSDVSVDPATGAVRLRAVFPNPRQELLPGLFVRARLDQGVKEQAITVPQRAVTRNPAGDAVLWVVGPDGTAAQRVIKTAQAIGDKWVVTEGLSAGEVVVVEGVQRLRPGIQVKTVPVAGGPSAAAAAAAGPAAK